MALKLLDEHNFMKFNGCPRQAYLLVNSSANAVMSRSEKYDMSRRLRDVQRDMLKSFPPGNRVCGDYLRAAEETAELIKKGKNVIYGAAFVSGRTACRCDVLIKRNGKYDVYAVRPTNRYSRWLDEVLYDRLVMEKCGVPTGKAYVCAIDKEAEGNNILCLVDAENPPRAKKMADKIDDIVQIVTQKKAPEAILSQRCGSCPYLSACFEAGADSIFSLKSIQFAKKASLYKNGIKTVSDFLSSGLAGDKALREIKVRETDEDVYDKAAIRGFLDNLSYPLGFLDFETVEVFFPGDPVLSPMDTVITQFSYHLIEKEGEEPKHYEFIGDGVSYPEREAAKLLCSIIKPDHCVLMYSNYERICIERLIKRLPEYAERLSAIANRLVDLEKPFSKKYLVNRRMQGKSSLKKVLPALYPGEKALDYKYMRIQNGQQAESVYARLPSMGEEEKKRAMRDLSDYCALDTLAMIKLVEKLIYYGRKEDEK